MTDTITSAWFSGAFPVTQGWRPGAGAYEPMHTGVDVGLPSGTHLHLPQGMAATVQDLLDPGGYGNYQVVTPDAAPSVHFILGHESQWLVPTGHYSGGEDIGLSGSTGWSTGPHLHFEEDTNGLYAGHDVNPLDALKGGQGGDPFSTAANALGGINPIPAINHLADELDPSKLGGRFLSGIATAFGVSNLTDLVTRAVLLQLGVILVIVGIVMLTRTDRVIVQAAKVAAVA